MNLFLWNVILALLWCAIQASFTVFDLAAGFLGGYLVILAAQPVIGRSSYYFGLWRAIAFLGFFTWELVSSSVRVAVQVLSPRLKVRPGIIAVPLDVQTDAAITFLANLNSLTPGTLSLDLSPDARYLYVHVMDVADEAGDEARREIKEGLERWVVELLK